MRIARGGLRLCVTQKLSDDRQSHTARSAYAGERMAQIVNAQIIKPGMFAKSPPWPIEVVARFVRLVAGNHVVADSLQFIQNSKCRTVEDNEPFARLAVGDQQKPALEIDIILSKVENFAHPTTGE